MCTLKVPRSSVRLTLSLGARRALAPVVRIPATPPMRSIRMEPQPIDHGPLRVADRVLLGYRVCPCASAVFASTTVVPIPRGRPVRGVRMDQLSVDFHTQFPLSAGEPLRVVGCGSGAIVASAPVIIVPSAGSVWRPIDLGSSRGSGWHYALTFHSLRDERCARPHGQSKYTRTGT